MIVRIQKRGGTSVLLMAFLTSALLAEGAMGASGPPTNAPYGPLPAIGAPSWMPVPDNGVITAPGSYFLAGDMAVDRKTGIAINADDVTLDLRGHALRFTGEPKSGVNGITFSGRSNIRIINGSLGGFWFGIHGTQSQRVRICDVHFDNIPYIGVNLSQATNAAITDNRFSNFRYDIKKDPGSTYLIGVNLTSDDVLVANNRFDAQPPAGSGQSLAMETVFVLFRPSRNCVVTHNDMSGSELMNRSYGIWVAEQTNVTVAYNRVRNTQYGVTVASDGSAVVGHNDFIVDPPANGVPAKIETVGISVPAPESFTETGNTFTGLRAAIAVAKPATKGK